MHYYEYWGCKKTPFDNVPDPNMYVSCHASAHSAISETLFAIEEGNECLAVIVGDVGLGKTMSLRMVMDSLQPGGYQIAFVVNPDMSFVQLLKEIVGQLTGEQCEIKKKMDLLETFNRLLFENAERGKKVVIFIDEANAMSPATLEKMRLLTNLQPDEVNLFTIVMAGQIEFAIRLAHPKRANLFQRVGTYCTLEKIPSPAVVKDYVQSRLALAGGTKQIFTEDAIEELYRYSEQGVPRLINKMAKLSLKAGETNSLQTITGEIISQIGDRFQKVADHSPKLKPLRPERKAEPPIEARREPKAAAQKVEAAPPPPAPPQPVQPQPVQPQPVQPQPVQPQPVQPQPVQPQPVQPQPVQPQPVQPQPVQPQPVQPATALAHSAPETEWEPDGPSEEPAVQNRVEVSRVLTAAAAEPPAKKESAATKRPHVEKAPPAPPTVDEEVNIDQYGVNVNIPADVITESRTFSEDQCVKLAGLLAAQTIQKHPRLTATWGTDPLAVWSDIREVILMRLKQGQNGLSR